MRELLFQEFDIPSTQVFTYQGIQYHPAFVCALFACLFVLGSGTSPPAAASATQVAVLFGMTFGAINLFCVGSLVAHGIWKGLRWGQLLRALPVETALAAATVAIIVRPLL